MAERSPAIQFYFRQFAGDEHVISLSVEAVGAHILLMCAAGASENGYWLPNDSKLLRAICHHMSSRKWQNISSELLNGAWKLSENGDRIEQTGMMRSFMKQKEFSIQQSERGKAGMKKRWDNARYDPVKPDYNSSPSSASTTSSENSDAYGVKGPPQNSGGASNDPPEIVQSLGVDELKGLQTTLTRSIRDRRLPSYYRANCQMRLEQVGEILRRKMG